MRHLTFAYFMPFIIVACLLKQGASESVSMEMSDINENANENSNSIEALPIASNNQNQQPTTTPTIISSSKTTVLTSTTTKAARLWTYFWLAYTGSGPADWNAKCQTGGGELAMPDSQVATNAVSAYTTATFPSSSQYAYWIGLTCNTTVCTWYDGTVLTNTSYNLWIGGLATALAAASTGKTCTALHSDNAGVTWYWISSNCNNANNAILCQK